MTKTTVECLLPTYVHKKAWIFLLPKLHIKSFGMIMLLWIMEWEYVEPNRYPVPTLLEENGDQQFWK